LISPLDAVAIFAAVWLLALGRRLPGWGIAGLLLLPLAIASVAIPDQRGLGARYFANTEFQEPFERRAPLSGVPNDVTRVDRRIDFTPGESELPLWWINSLERFNYQRADEPRRDRIPFSIEWEGYWWVETNGDVLGLYVDAPGATGELVIDGVKVLTMGPTDMVATASVEPLRGWHQLIIRLSAPATATRRFAAGQLIDNQRFPFDASHIAQRRLPSWQRTTLVVLDFSKRAVAIGVLAWLGVLVMFALRDVAGEYRTAASPALQRHAAVKIFALLAMIEACRFAWPWANRVMVLVGGDDTLTYESYARHILADGILMPHLAEPYFYQVLYPYFLAALHAVFGESMFGPMLIQRWLVAFVAWAIMYIAVKISRKEVWKVSLAVGVIFAYTKVGPISAKLLNESLFVPLLAGWTVMLLRVAGDPSTARAIRTGVLGGVTVLTRTPALLGLAAVIPALWRTWRGQADRTRFIVAITGCVALVVSLISIRNAMVVHAFMPLPGEFAVTLKGGNEPPPDLVLDLAKRAPLYDALGVHEFTRMVIEYAITAPGAFAANMARKALFALGYYEPYAPGFGMSVVFLIVSVAGIAGLVMVVRSGAVPIGIALVPALIAFSQFAAVVLVYPKGERLILPFQAIFAAYAAVAIDRIARRF
jgi:hypothetical protein